MLLYIISYYILYIVCIYIIYLYIKSIFIYTIKDTKDAYSLEEQLWPTYTSYLKADIPLPTRFV